MTDLDPVSEGILEMLRRIEEEVDADGWDQLPQLFWIVRVSTEDSEEIVAAFGLAEARIPEGLWRVTEPVWMVLVTLARALETYPGRADIVPPGFYGLAWVFEAWGLKNVTDEEHEALTRQPRGAISSDPARVEMRLVTGIDMAGTRYDITRERGGKVSTEAHEHGRPSQEDASRGRVPTAMDRLLKACLRHVPNEGV